METNYPKKVNYQDYEHAFNSYWLKEFVEGQLRYFDTEKMRGLIYMATPLRRIMRRALFLTPSVRSIGAKKKAKNA